MSSQETFSITELQRMCARSEYLEESDIHMNDKTVSWDGNIIYYEHKKPTATGNEFMIPIQVKGKEYRDLPKTNFIGYSVQTRDLKNYLKNGGVIFFVDAIEKTGFKNKMYAKILLPVDLIKLMEGKEKQAHITIYLKHIGTVRELEELCVLFNRNRPKQAMISIGTPILDYKSLSNFTMSTLPSKYTNPAVAIVKNSPAYFYTKKDGIDIPILMTGLLTLTEAKILIKVDDKINQRYSVRHIYTSDQTIIRISEVIEIVHSEKKYKIHIRCLNCLGINFESVYEAAKIIIAVSDAEKVLLDSLNISRDILGKIKSSFSEKFLDYYQRIIRIGKILEELKINKSLFKTKEILDAENEIYFLKSGLLETKILPLPFNTKEDCGIYGHIIGDKILLIEYEKVQENGYIIRKFFEDGKRIGVLEKDSNGKEHRISRWFYLGGQKVSRIIVDENRLLKEMKKIDEKEIDQLLFLVFDYLKAYDKEKSECMLSLAEKLFEILEKYLDSTLLTINRFQIIARRRKLSPEEKKILMPFKYSTNILARCCACVLLGQFDELDIHIQQLSVEEKKEFYNWPIASFLPGEKS